MTQKELNRQYRDQLNRLRRQERRMMLRGYSFEDEDGDYVGFVPQKTLIRPTAASIRKLKKITGSEFYKRGSFVDPYSGELFSAKEGRRIEIRNRGKGPKVPTPEPRPEPPTEPTPEPPSGGMSAVEIRSAIIDLLEYSSGLADYGGWINDRHKGRISGIKYSDLVKRKIAEIQTTIRGMRNDALNLAWDMIVARVESQMAYEGLGGGLGNDAKSAAAEFKKWSQHFIETVEIIKEALTDAVLALS